MSTTTATRTATYTIVDIDKVVRRVRADLVMIADSTGAWTAAQAADRAHDVELLAKKGFISWVDVTLLSFGTEIKAVRFVVDTDSGSLVSSRPGGVLWPKVAPAELRLTISHNDTYDAAAQEAMAGKLRLTWTTTYADTSHSSLKGGGGRNYTSNSYGMTRTDWS